MARSTCGARRTPETSLISKFHVWSCWSHFGNKGTEGTGRTGSRCFLRTHLADYAAHSVHGLVDQIAGLAGIGGYRLIRTKVAHQSIQSDAGQGQLLRRTIV